ncbi:MAG: DinB family protein [Tepidiformaceae bacterium]
MDFRDVLVNGLEHMNTWMCDAVEEMTPEQLNWLPTEGVAVSAGFNAWHIFRTEDNITNFVFQRKQPIWLAGGFMEKVGGPKVDQGTGMTLDDARAVQVQDKAALLEYGKTVAADTLAFVKGQDLSWLEETTTIKPQGELPRWRILREIYMTHGFMHLGEINVLRGIQGMPFRM